MQGMDLESEEFLVGEAVGLTLHEADVGVGWLEGAGGDGAIVPGEQAVAASVSANFWSVRMPQAWARVRTVVQEALGLGFVGLVSELAQVFLHVVGGGRGLVQGQGHVGRKCTYPLFRGSGENVLIPFSGERVVLGVKALRVGAVAMLGVARPVVSKIVKPLASRFPKTVLFS